MHGQPRGSRGVGITAGAVEGIEDACSIVFFFFSLFLSNMGLCSYLNTSFLFHIMPLLICFFHTLCVISTSLTTDNSVVSCLP